MTFGSEKSMHDKKNALTSSAAPSSWWPRPSQGLPVLGTNKIMALGVSSKDCSFGHPSAQRPCAESQCAPGRQRACKGVQGNALAKETSLPDEGGRPIGRVLIRAPTTLAGCCFWPTRNSPVCHAPRVN